MEWKTDDLKYIYDECGVDMASERNLKLVLNNQCLKSGVGVYKSQRKSGNDICKAQLQAYDHINV